MDKCQFCGNLLENEKNKKGRPLQYHKECRDLRSAINLLETRLIDWSDKHPKSDKKYRLRGDIMSLLNSVLN